MEADSTLLPEPPMPNIGSPRVRAAMKVLGVTTSELEKQDISAFDLESKYWLFEKKRRAIIQQVANLASSGPQGSHKTEPGSPPAPTLTAAERNAQYMEEVIRREKANMEVMERIAKKDIQKTVIEELEGKLQVHLSQKRQEESFERFRQLKKERHEKLKLAQKEAAKKAEKYKEVRERAKKEVEKHRQELKETLKQADERVSTMLTSLKEAHVEEVQKAQEKFVVIAERQENFAQSLVRRREQMHDEIESKHEAKRELLASFQGARQSHKEEILEREMQCREKVQKSLEEKQAKAEEKYWEICERHKKAQEYRESNVAAWMKEMKTSHTKKKNAHEARYTKLLNEKDKEHQDFVKRTLQRSASETLKPTFERQELLKAREDANNHVELAAWNRERLKRAHAYEVEQQLEKLLAMRERTQIMFDVRAEADKRRMIVLRNATLEKQHLTDKVDRVRDAGPDRMLKLLDDVELEPAAAKKINDILGNLGLAPVGGVVQEEEK